MSDVSVHVGWASGLEGTSLCREDAGQSWVELSPSPVPFFAAARGLPVSSHTLRAGEGPSSF